MRKFNFLGIQNEHACITRKGVYLLFSDSEEFGIQLASSSLDEHNKSFAITIDPERFISMPSYNPNYKCEAFTLDSQYFSENPNEFISQLFEELTYYSGFKNSHLVIHFSETLVNRFNVQFISDFLKKIRKLSSKYDVSVLVLLTGKSSQNRAADFLVNSTLLDGVAYLNSQLMNHSLVFDFWRHEGGFSTKVNYQLFFEDEPFAELIEQKYEEAVLDQRSIEQVFIASELLPSDTKLPPHYFVCQDNESVVENAKMNKAATVVFCASRDIEKTVLAAQCYELRDTCGPWLKIVIKNKDGVLRHHDECVFLTLGVNLILHTTTDISRLMSQVQALQGVKFARVLPKDYKKVLTYANSVEAKGYVTPKFFIDAVKKQRESSLSTGISGVLVVLDLIKGVDPIDALRLFSVKRNGDFYTANDSQVLLYLHGCRENDVANALERLFRLAISEFFMSDSIYSQDLYIEEICRDLKRAIDNHEIEDYSIQLLETVIEEKPLAMSTSGRTSGVINHSRLPSRKPCKPFPIELMDKG